MAKLKSYQIAAVHTDDYFSYDGGYEWLTAPIVGHQNAFDQLYNLWKSVSEKGQKPSIIWRDTFMVGPTVYRLVPDNGSYAAGRRQPTA